MTTAIIFMGAVIILVIVGVVISKRMRDSAWKQFAAEIGGEFVDNGFFRSSKV